MQWYSTADGVEERGLAGPAGADQRNQLAGADLGVDGPDAAAPFGVDHGGAVDAQRRSAVDRFGESFQRAVGRGRGGEHLVQLLGGVGAGLRGVERRAHASDRQRALGCEQQDDERGLQRDGTDREPVADRHRDQRHRQHGQQLHHGRREERDLEGAHDRLSVLLRHGTHPLDLRLLPAEQPQRGQSDEHVVEVTGKSLQGRPLAVGALLGQLADQHHEHRDERDRDQEDHRRRGICEQDPGTRCERHDAGQAQGRYAAADPRIERVDAVGDEGGDPSGRDQRSAGFVDAQRVADHPLADRSAGFVGSCR